VGINLKAIEQLATDQASLKAAAGLAKPGKWSGLGASPDGALIWGECAGSGANPYRVMADLRDLGNKCTCPSRKFPCKHVLALFWVNAEALLPFPPAETPEWVGDWLKRRRGGGAAVPKAPDAGPGPAKDVRAAELAEPEALEDPKAAARRDAAAAKRAEDTERAVLDALAALEQWIGDQLRMGLSAFIDDATSRCRRIAARLVDGKAAALAGRIDELPARLLALPAGDRPRGAVVELGKFVLLARAFRAAPSDAEIRRAVASSETRETVLGDPGALRMRGTWEVLAELVRTRRDGLVSQTTWLINLGTEGPRFAMLLDYFPASAGRRGLGFTPGERFLGELAFFPARNPLRALLIEREPIGGEGESEWPEPEGALAEALSEPLVAEPWALDGPVLLPAGRFATDAAGQGWWRPHDGATALPLAAGATGLIRGTELTRAAALWSGNRLAILAARTPWGRIDGHG
jgi:hypothetical protein